MGQSPPLFSLLCVLLPRSHYLHVLFSAVSSLLKCNPKAFKAIKNAMFVFFNFILFLFGSIQHCQAFHSTFLSTPSVLLCSVMLYPVLLCYVLFCPVLLCPVLFCSVLFCSVLFHSVLFYSVLFCSVLFRYVLFCSVLFGLPSAAFSFFHAKSQILGDK